jgi:ABC-type lipoprotein export system ATPase subunit
VLLTLEHVAKANRVGPCEKRTLVDVSLTLAAGDFAGVWGGHRSGKSTLLRIAAGMELPDSGVSRRPARRARGRAPRGRRRRA